MKNSFQITILIFAARSENIGISDKDVTDLTEWTDLAEVVGVPLAGGGGCQDHPGDKTSCLDTEHFTELLALI